MNWDQYLTALHAGGHELAELVDEAQGGPRGGALTTTRLLHDQEEMASLSRRIQERCEGTATTLFAGLRRAEHLGREPRGRFERLASSGVTAVLYGVGVPETLPPGVRWVEVPPRSSALENQWFVVTEAPEPVALMSFALPAQRPVPGGRGPAGPSLAAFVSSDGRLVEAVVRILRTVAARRGVVLEAR
jgi:hypothetical protein